LIAASSRVKVTCHEMATLHTISVMMVTTASPT
jgi:hypothetical protein